MSDVLEKTEFAKTEFFISATNCTMDHANIEKKCLKLTSYGFARYYCAKYDGIHLQYRANKLDFLRANRDKAHIFILVHSPIPRTTTFFRENAYELHIIVENSLQSYDITRICCLFRTSDVSFCAANPPQFVNQFVLRYYLGGILTNEHAYVKHVSTVGQPSIAYCGYEGNESYASLKDIVCERFTNYICRPFNQRIIIKAY